MAIKLGTNDIDALKLGANDVDKAYLGSDLVYEKAGSGGSVILNGVTNSAGGITISVPTHTEGDILIITFTEFIGIKTVAPPTGWTSLANFGCNNSSLNRTSNAGLFAKVASASEPPSYTLDTDSSAVYTAMYSFSNTSFADVIVSESSDCGSSVPVLAPAITPVGDCYIVAAAGGEGQNSNSTGDQGDNPTGSTLLHTGLLNSDRGKYSSYYFPDIKTATENAFTIFITNGATRSAGVTAAIHTLGTVP